MSVRQLGYANIAGTALLPNRLAYLNAGVLDYLPATGQAPYLVTDDVAVAGKVMPCSLLVDGATKRLTASKAIAAGATLYTAASGQVTDTTATGARKVGVALQAASGAGSVIECAPCPSPTAEP